MILAGYGLSCDFILLETLIKIAMSRIFYAGMPTVTENLFCEGKAYHIPTET